MMSIQISKLEVGLLIQMFCINIRFLDIVTGIQFACSVRVMFNKYNIILCQSTKLFEILALLIKLITSLIKFDFGYVHIVVLECLDDKCIFCLNCIQHLHISYYLLLVINRVI